MQADGEVHGSQGGRPAGQAVGECKERVPPLEMEQCELSTPLVVWPGAWPYNAA